MSSFLRRVSSCRSMHATAVRGQGRRRPDDIENERLKESVKNWLKLVEQSKKPNEHLEKLKAIHEKNERDSQKTHQPKPLQAFQKIVNRFKSNDLKKAQAAADKINLQVQKAKEIAQEAVVEAGEDINLNDFL